jgi:DNA-binding XRE family transcriptional regulator
MQGKKERPMTQFTYREQFNVLTRSTELSVIGNHGVVLKCYISNRYSARNRRQFLLSVYSRVLPLFEFVDESTIHHSHHIDDFTTFDKVRIQSTKQAILIEGEQGKLGYLIRGIRSKLNMTQKDFSKELGITRTYLSKIEKGHVLPSRKILKKLEQMKNAPEVLYP